MFSFNNAQDRNVIFKENVDKDLISKIDKYDADMLSYIARLYQTLNGEKLNLSEVKNAVDALSMFNSKQQYNYLNNLLHPEKCKGVKIPSPIPVPSCAFQLHNCVTLPTNDKGNLAILFNPMFLYSQTFSGKSYQIPNGSSSTFNGGVNWLSSFFFNNSNNLTGHSYEGTWSPVNLGQGIPNVYDQYRLVSASIVIKYIGRLDIVSGVIGGAIIFD